MSWRNNQKKTSLLDTASKKVDGDAVEIGDNALATGVHLILG